MQEKIEKLKAQISYRLKEASAHFTEWNEAHKIRMAQIEGLISALEIITGKCYLIAGTELKEYKGE